MVTVIKGQKSPFGQIAEALGTSLESVAEDFQKKKKAEKEQEKQDEQTGALYDHLHKGTEQWSEEERSNFIQMGPDFAKISATSTVKSRQTEEEKQPLTTNEQINQIRSSAKEKVNDSLLEVTIETQTGRIIDPEADKKKVKSALRQVNGTRKKESSDLEKIYKKAGLEVPETIKFQEELTVMDLYDSPEALLQDVSERVRKLGQKYKKMKPEKRNKLIEKELIEFGFDMAKINELQRQMANQ